MTDTKAADHYWYARNCTKFQNKTGHLSLMEMGAYDRLLDWYYLNRKPIPDDWVQMHRICRAVAPDEQAAVQVVVSQFFVLEKDGWHNKTADEEIAKAQGISQKRREAQAEKERKRLAKEGANAPANAPTITVTDTILDTNVSSNKAGGVSAPEVSMNFEKIWNAYPSRGKDGMTGAGFKGHKKTAQLKFETIYKNTKEADRENLIRSIIDGCAKYRQFLERTDYPSKHLSTWLNAAGWETDYGVSATAQANPRRGGEGYLETMYAKAMGDQTHRHLREGGGNQGSGMGVDPSDIRGSDVLVDENDGALSKG